MRSRSVIFALAPIAFTVAIASCDGSSAATGGADGGPANAEYAGPCGNAPWNAACVLCVNDSCASEITTAQSDCAALYSCLCGDGGRPSSCTAEGSCSTSESALDACEQASCAQVCPAGSTDGGSDGSAELLDGAAAGAFVGSWLCTYESEAGASESATVTIALSSIDTISLTGVPGECEAVALVSSTTATFQANQACNTADLTIDSGSVTLNVNTLALTYTYTSTGDGTSTTTTLSGTCTRQ